MVELVLRIVEAVVRRELQFIEAWNSLPGTLRPQRRPGGCCSSACGGAHVGRKEGPVETLVEDAGHPGSPLRSSGRPGQWWKHRPWRRRRVYGLQGGGGVPESHGGSGDSKCGKGTRWMGTLSGTDVVSRVAKGGADGTESAACVVATDDTWSAACVVARGRLRRRWRRLGLPAHEELVQKC
jgi:hypothetical protein